MNYNWQHNKIPLLFSVIAFALTLGIGIPVSYAFFNGDTRIKGNEVQTATLGIETTPEGIVVLGNKEKNKGPKKHDSVNIKNIGSIPLQLTVKDVKVSENCSPYDLAYKIKSNHGLLSEFSPITIEEGKHQKLRIMFEKGTESEEDLSCTVNLTLVAWQIQFNEPNKGFVVKKQITLDLEIKGKDKDKEGETPTPTGIPSTTPTPTVTTPSVSPSTTPSASPSLTPTDTTLPEPTVTEVEPTPTDLPSPTSSTSD